MNRARALLLAAFGLALPAGLALAVYLTSAGPLAAVPAVVSVPSQQIARPVATTTTERETTTAPTTTEERDDDDRDDPLDDLPGKCDDPDHRLDPDCDPRLVEAEDDSSGPGSGSDDSSGSGSGSDDDSSGKGSGDDD
ncbi:MAG: hypothetical protein ACRDNI_00420 [Gaiellaceae bacterium]